MTAVKLQTFIKNNLFLKNDHKTVFEEAVNDFDDKLTVDRLSIFIKVIHFLIKLILKLVFAFSDYEFHAKLPVDSQIVCQNL